jgi:hypothetical protein
LIESKKREGSPHLSQREKLDYKRENLQLHPDQPEPVFVLQAKEVFENMLFLRLHKIITKIALPRRACFVRPRFRCTSQSRLLSLNVKQDTADKIRALQTYLGPGWLALWEDDGHLRFLAPELIQLYRA